MLDSSPEEVTEAFSSRTRPPDRWWSRSVSAWQAAAAVCAAAGLVLSADVVHDPDLYWHRIVGHQFLHGNWQLRPDPISYVIEPAWHSGSWLMDVVYAALVATWGYAGIIGLRFVLAAAFFAGLVLLVRRSGATPGACFLVTLVVALPAVPVMQDRPQTVSFVLILGLSAVLDRILVRDELPRWWTLVPATWVWANVHGLWVAIPFALALLALREAVTRSPARGTRTRAVLGRCALAVAAAACTPMGPALLLSPWRVSRAARDILEWQPTAMTAATSWGFGAVVLSLVLGWALGRSRPSPGDLAYCGGWVAFGLIAARNTVPVSIVLAPMAARALSAAVPALTRSTARVPAWSLIVVAVAGLAAGAARYTQVPVLSPDQPAKIAATLASRPASRVMAMYNISGFIREFGGDNVRVALDGRADRYGAKRIAEYVATFNGQGHWRTVVRRYDPDYVVAATVTPLPELLRTIGWQPVQRDGDFVLLAAPGR